MPPAPDQQYHFSVISTVTVEFDEVDISAGVRSLGQLLAAWQLAKLSYMVVSSGHERPTHQPQVPVDGKQYHLPPGGACP